MTNKNTNTPHRVPFYRRPIFLIGTGIIITVSVIITLIIVFARPSAPSESNQPEETKLTSLKSSAEPSEPSESDTPDAPSEEESDEPKGILQYEGKDPNKRNDITGSIAYRGVDQDSGILTVTTSIDQYLHSSGECKLRLLSGDRELYSETLPATADVTTSVCGPFEAPLTQLGSGTIKIEITVTADDKTGLITDEVQI